MFSGAGCSRSQTLPDETILMAGNGVIAGAALLKLYGGDARLTRFDLAPLDKWLYGLRRDYELSQNYSDEITSQ